MGYLVCAYWVVYRMLVSLGSWYLDCFCIFYNIQSPGLINKVHDIFINYVCSVKSPIFHSGQCWLVVSLLLVYNLECSLQL